jgi:tRNA (guanine-N7-)-methyltransferase
MVSLQFPDPWFKKKHAKRRMVNGHLVRTVVDKLAVHGSIFIQTDIQPLADEIFDHFAADKRLKSNRLLENPFPVKTEREMAVEAKGEDVYRAVFEKLSKPQNSSEAAKTDGL